MVEPSCYTVKDISPCVGNYLEDTRRKAILKKGHIDAVGSKKYRKKQNIFDNYVSDLQKDLKKLGFSEVGGATGLFGEKTERAVKRFQRIARFMRIRKWGSLGMALATVRNFNGKIDGVVENKTKKEIKVWKQRGWMAPRGTNALVSFAEDCVVTRKFCTYDPTNNCSHFVSHALLVAGIDDRKGNRAGKLCPDNLIVRAKELQKWLDKNASKVEYINKIEPGKVKDLVKRLQIKLRKGDLILLKFGRRDYGYGDWAHAMVYVGGDMVAMHSNRGRDRKEKLEDTLKARSKECVIYRPKYP